MDYPSEWETEFTLKNGKRVSLRPTQSGDTEMLWRMFSMLSEKSLSNLASPFTRERVEGWTSDIDYDRVLTIVAVIDERSKGRIVAAVVITISGASYLLTMRKREGKQVGLNACA
jgi:hypothetical protein